MPDMKVERALIHSAILISTHDHAWKKLIPLRSETAPK